MIQSDFFRLAYTKAITYDNEGKIYALPIQPYGVQTCPVNTEADNLLHLTEQEYMDIANCHVLYNGVSNTFEAVPEDQWSEEHSMFNDMEEWLASLEEDKN